MIFSDRTVVINFIENFQVDILNFGIVLPERKSGM
jgi:hypothetical protein